MKNQNVHFVGIGGIGVSALARWYQSGGWEVNGSDLEGSEITEKLCHEGMRVAIGPHNAQNIPKNARLVIYSAAAEKNPEIAAARKHGIPVKSYAQALGDITREYLTIAVAGSHGKSTTTAFLALMCMEAGFDPTVIIGTKLRELAHPADWREVWLSSGKSAGANFRKGRSPLLIIEADEWNGSFWNYSPGLIVITNVDKEHLDFYKTLSGVRAAFKKFILKSRPGSRIVVNADDKDASGLVKGLLKKYPKRFKGRIHYYSLRSPQAAYLRPYVALSGRHNASNAMAAAAAAEILNIPSETVKRVLSQFDGAWRRFETVGELNGAPIIADYAHHPTEIKSTLSAARARFGGKKIIAVFQPHHYERTRDLFGEFQKAFDDGDAVCLLDIYEVAGREKKRRNRTIHSFNLAKAIASRGKNAHYIPYTSKLHEFLKAEAGPNSVIIMMGAGSIWKITKDLIKSSNNESAPNI